MSWIGIFKKIPKTRVFFQLIKRGFMNFLQMKFFPRVRWSSGDCFQEQKVSENNTIFDSKIFEKLN